MNIRLAKNNLIEVELNLLRLAVDSAPHNMCFFNSVTGLASSAKALNAALSASVPKEAPEFYVHDPDAWENAEGPENWWAVSGVSGIICYFNNAEDAHRHADALNLGIDFSTSI